MSAAVIVGLISAFAGALVSYFLGRLNRRADQVARDTYTTHVVLRELVSAVRHLGADLSRLPPGW